MTKKEKCELWKKKLSEYYAGLKPIAKDLEEQKQHIIDIMKKDEELGLYDIFNDEKKQGIKELIDKQKLETLENKLKSLFWKWQRRQVEYERLAEKHSANEHNCKKFTYKAVATRDCWKELITLLNKYKDE